MFATWGGEGSRRLYEGHYQLECTIEIFYIFILNKSMYFQNFDFMLKEDINFF
jgi:hypothetical protein